MSDERPSELASAMSKARAEFAPIERSRTVQVKTKTGGSYSFNYAPLDAILAATVPALCKHGVDYDWSPTIQYEERTDNDGAYTVALVTQRCRLTHTSGQSRESSITLLTNEVTPQGIGSVLTYGRRYTYEHVVGVVSEDDDDGNHASGNHAEQSARTKTPSNIRTLPPCPKCGKTVSVIAGKDEHGAGLVCWKKKDGCGHTWGTDEYPIKGKHQEAIERLSQPKDDEPPKDWVQGLSDCGAESIDALTDCWASMPQLMREPLAERFLRLGANFGKDELAKCWSALGGKLQKVERIIKLKDELKAQIEELELSKEFDEATQ